MFKGKLIDIVEAERLLVEERLTRQEIARRLGVCRERLGIALRHLPVSAGHKGVSGTYRLVEARAANAASAEKRRQDIRRLSEQGVPQREIARQLGCSRSSIWRTLNPARKPAVLVPSWVPAYLADTYRLVGRELGEEAAASRVRRLKKEAEGACL